MLAFRGQDEYTLDNKGRLMIPAKHRKKIEEEFKAEKHDLVLVRGFDQCIQLYPKTEWEKIEIKLSERSSFDPEARTLFRLFSTMIEDTDIDNQGRVTLPKRFTEFAAIEKDVVILGAGEKIELWNPAKLNEFINRTLPLYEGLAQKVLSSNATRG
jgi:MraZ protein